MKFHALFFAFLPGICSLAQADIKEDRLKLIEEQTTIINSNATENNVLAALVNRAEAYMATSEYAKAGVDTEKALGMLERHRDLIDYLPIRFTIWKNKGEVAFYAKDYDTARQAFTEAASTDGWEKFSDAVEFLLYRSQNHLYQHSLIEARIEAEQALKLGDAKQTGQFATVNRVLSVVYFEMGDLDGALSLWNDARKNVTYLGDAPFAPEQIPFNRAVYENRDTSKAAGSILARANYFLTAAKNLEKERSIAAGKIYYVGDDSPPTIYGSGGFSNLVIAKKANATPTTLADDALLELKIAEDYQYNPADFFAIRASARAYRWRIDDWDKDRKLNFKLTDVDTDYNQAIAYKPFDTDVRRGRAEWLDSRLSNLKRDTVGPLLTPEQEAETRLTLCNAAIEDISRVLLKMPDDTKLRSRRIALEAELDGKLDLNTVIVDYDTLVPLLKGAEQTKTIAVREKIRGILTAFKPTTGTALEWKTKGITLAQKEDYQGACDAFTKALLLDPKFTDVLHNRANAYLKRGVFDTAMLDENAALAIDPRHKAAYIGRSAIKVGVGDFDGAVADARKAIEVAPDETWRKNSRENLAKTLMARADPQIGIKTPEALLAIWTDYHEANSLTVPTFEDLLIEGQAATYLRHGADALTALNKASAIKPNEINVLLFKTIVLTALNDPQAAASEKHVMAFNNRGADSYGSIDQIAREFAKGAAFNPKNATAEKARLTALQERIWNAWYDSTGGLTLNGKATN